jgi:hypothetical protein
VVPSQGRERVAGWDLDVGDGGQVRLDGLGVSGVGLSDGPSVLLGGGAVSRAACSGLNAGLPKVLDAGEIVVPGG